MQRSAIFDGKIGSALSALAAVSTVLGNAILSRCAHLTVYVVFGAGTSAGQFTVETAPYADYTGTWSTIGTIDWAAASRAHHLSISAAHGAVRVRCSVAVVGGTADIHAVARS